MVLRKGEISIIADHQLEWPLWITTYAQDWILPIGLFWVLFSNFSIGLKGEFGVGAINGGLNDGFLGRTYNSDQITSFLKAVIYHFPSQAMITKNKMVKPTGTAYPTENSVPISSVSNLYECQMSMADKSHGILILHPPSVRGQEQVCLQNTWQIGHTVTCR